MRPEERAADELRPITNHRNFTNKTPGSVLIQAGETMVLCTASISESLPAWMNSEEQHGWVTAEYNMLPGSTTPRKARERGGKIDGRSSEIQRLIGRSLRAVVDLDALGPRAVTIDCDVLQADGGTRTLSITGAIIALTDALHSIEEFRDKNQGDAGFPIRDLAAAVSVGLVEGEPRLDLCYVRLRRRSRYECCNVPQEDVHRNSGTGEEALSTTHELRRLLELARKGIRELCELQETPSDNEKE